MTTTEKERWVTAIPEVLFDALMDATVSSTGTTITIECGSHDTKDAILNFLTGSPVED